MQPCRSTCLNKLLLWFLSSVIRGKAMTQQPTCINCRNTCRNALVSWLLSRVTRRKDVHGNLPAASVETPVWMLWCHGSWLLSGVTRRKDVHGNLPAASVETPVWMPWCHGSWLLSCVTRWKDVHGSLPAAYVETPVWMLWCYDCCLVWPEGRMSMATYLQQKWGPPNDWTSTWQRKPQRPWSLQSKE